jgi:hypothetical protein
MRFKRLNLANRTAVLAYDQNHLHNTYKLIIFQHYDSGLFGFQTFRP